MEDVMQEVCTEVSEIIKHMPKEYQDKIPINVIEFFEKQIKKDYKVNIEQNNIFDKSKLKEETLAVIAMLNIKYWCPNETIKKHLIKKYNDNEKQYQEEIRQKYNPDDLFKNKNQQQQKLNSLIVGQEEKWYRKIFNIIKKLFKNLRPR